MSTCLPSYQVIWEPPFSLPINQTNNLRRRARNSPPQSKQQFTLQFIHSSILFVSAHRPFMSPMGTHLFIYQSTRVLISWLLIRPPSPRQKIKNFDASLISLRSLCSDNLKNLACIFIFAYLQFSCFFFSFYLFFFLCFYFINFHHFSFRYLLFYFFALFFSSLFFFFYTFFLFFFGLFTLIFF